jgi:hypothetical protein
MPDKSALTKFLTTAAQDIAAFDSGLRIAPFTGTMWVASSLLQKAIRRNHVHAARQAGRFLLAAKGNMLFRRLNVIAVEDIGMADLQTVGVVAAVLTSAKVRRDLGGDERVTDYLIRRMVDARKSRAADDLLMAVERWPGLDADRTHFAQMTKDRLRQIVLGCPSLDRKALALWYLVGTARCPSSHLPTRRGDPDMAFATLADLGVAPTLLAIARENFIKTATMLAPFVALLSLENGIVATGVADDRPPVETIIRGVPSWAFDMYTRPGRAALGRLLHKNAGMASWSERFLPRTNRVQVAGDLLFRLEGQCLYRRAVGPLSTALREKWETASSGLTHDALAFGMEAMREAMPTLNTIRAEVVAEGVA